MIFITQGNYTAEAMAGMVDKPEDRAVSVKKLMEANDTKMLGYYFTYGHHDFMLIGEAKDERTWMAFLVLVAATGTVTNVRDHHRQSPHAEAKKVFKSAKEIRLLSRLPRRRRKVAPTFSVASAGWATDFVAHLAC